MEIDEEKSLNKETISDEEPMDVSNTCEEHHQPSNEVIESYTNL